MIIARKHSIIIALSFVSTIGTLHACHQGTIPEISIEPPSPRATILTDLDNTFDDLPEESFQEITGKRNASDTTQNVNGWTEDNDHK